MSLRHRRGASRTRRRRCPSWHRTRPPHRRGSPSKVIFSQTSTRIRRRPSFSSYFRCSGGGGGCAPGAGDDVDVAARRRREDPSGGDRGGGRVPRRGPDPGARRGPALGQAPMAAPVRRRRPTGGDGERRGTNGDAGPGVDGERRSSERERGVGGRRRGRRPGPRHLRPVRRSIHPGDRRRGSRRASPRVRRGRAREGRLQVQGRRRRRGGRGVRRGVRDARVHPARPRPPGDGGRVERAGVPDPDGSWWGRATKGINSSEPPRPPPRPPPRRRRSGRASG